MYAESETIWKFWTIFILIFITTRIVRCQLTADVDDYFHEGEGEVQCGYRGAIPPGGILVVYPPWTGRTGADRCAKLSTDGTDCDVQNSCKPNVQPNHGEYQVGACEVDTAKDEYRLSLKITGGNDINSGNNAWTCAVYASGSNSQTKDVNLWKFIQAPEPQIEGYSTSGWINVTEAMVPSLSCSYPAPTPAPRPHLSWYRKPPGSSPAVLLGTRYSAYPAGPFTLNYTPEREHQDNTVYCEARQDTKHSQLKTSKFLQLNVHYPVSLVEPPQNVTILNTDDNLKIQCKYEGNPLPEVTITGQSGLLNYTTDDNGYTRRLLIGWGTDDLDKRKKLNQEVVFCTGSNGIGGQKISQTFVTNVMFGAGRPQLVLSQNEADVGTSVRLTCLEGQPGNPAVYGYSWYRAGVNISYTHLDSFLDLNLDNIVQENNYTCSVANFPVGYDAVHSKQSEEEQLIVNVPPEFVLPVAAMTVTRNQSSPYRLECAGVGKPALPPESVTWSSPSLSPGRHNISSSTLPAQGPYGLRTQLLTTLEGLPAADDCGNVDLDDGEYMCSVGNITSNIITVETHYAAMWSGSEYNPQYKAALGDNVSLVCDICSNPPAIITWYRDDTAVPGGEGMALNITLTDRGQYGGYTCRGENLQGAEVFPLGILPEGPPLPPEELAVSEVWSRGAGVAWLAGWDGGVTDMDFVLERRPGGQQIKVTKDGGYRESEEVKVVMEGLEPETEYALHVTAFNSYKGRSQSQTQTIAFSTEATPVINIAALTLTENDVTVTWNMTKGVADSLSLGHKISTNQESRDTIGGYEIILSGIDAGNLTFTAYKKFDLDKVNMFALFVYERSGLNASGQTPEGDGTWRPIRNNNDGGIIAGIVLGVMAMIAIIIVVTLFLTRKKTEKKAGMQNLKNETSTLPSSYINPSFTTQQAQPQQERESQEKSDDFSDLYARPIPKKDRPKKLAENDNELYVNAGQLAPSTEIQANVEQLNYADLDFGKSSPSSSPAEIRRKEDPIEYATIDFQTNQATIDFETNKSGQ